MSAPRVVSVAAASPAQRARLQVGDELLAIDGRVPRDVIEYRLLVDEANLAGSYDFHVGEFNSKEEFFQLLRDQLGLVVTSPAAITINSVKSNEAINQQTVYLGPKVTLQTHVVKKKDKKYKVVFDYQAMEADELELKTNDIVEVKPTDRSEGGWSSGTNTRTGQFGVFPLNYTEVVA